MKELKFKRVLLKLSGEALLGQQSHGIDPSISAEMGRALKTAVDAGAQVAVVIGGGNIFRGVSLEQQGIDRVTGDHMGMLATVMNALALHGAVEKTGQPARVMSAIEMPTVCERYSRAKAEHHLNKNRVVICGGGTGNPFFTTDTAATLRASELRCDCVIKVTQVDGIYDKDPKKHSDAKRYETISYDDVLTQNLKVMDATAIALARETSLPVMVAGADDLQNIADWLRGTGRASVVTATA